MAYLDVVVFRASDYQVLIVSRLIHSQTHDWTQVANELPSGGEPGSKEAELKMHPKDFVLSGLIKFQFHSTSEAAESC